MRNGKLKYLLVGLVVLGLLLPGCAAKVLEPKDVVSLAALTFDLDEYLGKKVWVSGFYGDDRFTGDDVAFLVSDFHMLVVDEELSEGCFVRLDGELPPYEMNGEEVLVYGEVQEFSEAYGAFTLRPTPLVTVAEYRAGGVSGLSGESPTPLGLTGLIAPLLRPGTALAAGDAAAPTRAGACDRALILSGGIDTNNNRSRFRRNVEAKYRTLKELGYTDGQIEVLYNDGDSITVDGANVVDGKASKKKIKDALDRFKRAMPASCTLTVFVTDHGKGYNEGQGYHGARPAQSGTDTKTKTYPESSFELDLCRYVYASMGHLKVKDKEWDTDADGEVDLKAECDWDTKEYVLKRKTADGSWREIGRASGEVKWGIKCMIKGVDWNMDGDKDDQVGFHEGVNLWGTDVLWDDELAELLKPLHDNGIHIVVEMSQCFAGGFVDNLKGVVEKIVAFSGEDSKHHNRKGADGKYYAADQKAFVDSLSGIDVQSWDKAFEKAKEADAEKWRAEGGSLRRKNEYTKWEKPLVPSDSTFFEREGEYRVTLKLPETLRGKVYDLELFFGLQQPRWDFGAVLELPDGFTRVEIPGGIRIVSTEPFPITPLRLRLKGAAGGGSIRIELTDREHNSLGYLLPALKEQVLVPAEEALSATLDAESKSLATETGCDSLLIISFDARDLTDGTSLVTRAVLRVNGDVWHDSGSIRQLHYQGSVDRHVLCGEVFELELRVTNEDGQTVRSTHEIETPAPPPFPGQVLSVDVRADAESISDASGCRSILSIDHNAYDLTAGDARVANVVLRVNGDVWHDSGSIFTVHYYHSIESRVDCGEAFMIEVIAMNEDGQVATASAFIVTPQP